jgi:hypothetical protein
MGRASETSDEKYYATSTHVSRAVKDVDTAAELVSGEQEGILDPASGEVSGVRFVAPKT